MENLKNLIELFETFNDAIYVVDNNRKMLYFNPKATEITGYQKDEVVGHYCYDNILNHVDDEGNNLCVHGCPLMYAINKNKKVEKHVYLKHKGGYRVPVFVKAMPYIVNDEVVGAIEVFSDESEQSLVKDFFPVHRNLDLVDPLTGLYNRRLLEHKFNVYVKQQNVKSIGVLFVDFDYFKDVNDTYGHLAGDEILTLLANTIIHNIRRKDLAMRYGGDEVVVFFFDVTREELQKSAEKLRVLINKSESRKYKDLVTMTASIGGVIKEPSETILNAIDRADKAMLIVKQNGKNNVLIK